MGYLKIRFITHFFIILPRLAMRSVIISACFFCLFLSSCSRSVFGSRDKTQELTQRVIFVFLKQPSYYLDQLTGKGLIKLDSLLCRRDVLNINGKIYFDTPIHSNALQYPLSQKSYRLVIPNSLAGKYRYAGPDKDYEHDYSIIHQFSPLLPTTERDIFLMEHHIWANLCDDTGCVRALNRGYLKFRIENEEITFIDFVGLTNQIDFIGFGGFSKKKMNEALPGEKIAEFGW